MQESVMAPRALLSFAAAAAFIAGCDASPPKPETAQPIRAGKPETVQPASGDRSIRLFGPGVNRQKQIRV
jgi:hypothetical protein